MSGKVGRPPYQPTPETRAQVELMSASGIQQELIAKVMSISRHTLEKHYRRELDTATAKVVAKVAAQLFKTAMGDGPQSVLAQIFTLKTRGRWKEAPQEQRHQMTGKDGGPIQTIDISKLSHEQLIALEPVLAQLVTVGPDADASAGEDSES